MQSANIQDPPENAVEGLVVSETEMLEPMVGSTEEQLYPNPMGACADAGKFRDVWFAVIWLICILAVVGLGCTRVQAGIDLYTGTITITSSQSKTCSTGLEFELDNAKDMCQEGLDGSYFAAFCTRDGKVALAHTPSLQECRYNMHTPNFFTYVKLTGNSTECTQIGDVLIKVTSTSCKVQEVSRSFYETVAISAGVAFVFSTLWIVFMLKAPRASILFGNGFIILVYGGLAALGFVYGNLALGIMCTILVVIGIVFMVVCWRRIEFAAMCLSLSSGVALTYWGVIVSAFFNLAIQAAFCMLWFAAVGIDVNSPIFWVGLFIGYWGKEVFINLTHVTMAGVTAEWFFGLGGPGTPLLVQQQRGQPNPSFSSMCRAYTWSLGSVCMGSLIVAFIRTLRMLARHMRSNRNAIIAIVACILQCILACLEDLIGYFNDYAYVQVATYGKPYVTAAKDTWQLVSTGEAWSALINDCMVDWVFLTCMLFSGSLSGVACGFLLGLIWGIVGFVAGVLVSSTMMKLIYSGVITVFVCFWELKKASLQWSPPALNDQNFDVFHKKLNEY